MNDVDKEETLVAKQDIVDVLLNAKAQIVWLEKLLHTHLASSECRMNRIDKLVEKLMKEE